MSGRESDWTYFSNYVHVLVCLAGKPRSRLVEIANQVGVTERTAFRIVRNLEEAGVLTRIKEGRRNSYVINPNRHMRHPLEAHCTVGDILRVILEPSVVRRIERQFERSQVEQQEMGELG